MMNTNTSPQSTRATGAARETRDSPAKSVPRAPLPEPLAELAKLLASALAKRWIEHVKSTGDESG